MAILNSRFLALFAMWMLSGVATTTVQADDDAEMAALKAMMKKMKEKGMNANDLLAMMDDSGPAEATIGADGSVKSPTRRSSSGPDLEITDDDDDDDDDQPVDGKSWGETNEKEQFEIDLAELSSKIWGDAPRPKTYCFYAALQLRKKLEEHKIESNYQMLVEKYPAGAPEESLEAEIHLKIKEAHMILSNKETKDMYDQFGMKGFESWEEGYKPRKPMNNAFYGLMLNKMKNNGFDDESIDEVLDILKELEKNPDMLGDEEETTEEEEESEPEKLDGSV